MRPTRSTQSIASHDAVHKNMPKAGRAVSPLRGRETARELVAKANSHFMGGGWIDHWIKSDYERLSRFADHGSFRRSDIHAGFVYVATNPFMKGLIKVGLTDGPVFYRAWTMAGFEVIPAPFVFEGYFAVADRRLVEKLAHAELDHCRIFTRKEFFRCTVAEGLAAIRKHAGVDALEVRNG